MPRLPRTLSLVAFALFWSACDVSRPVIVVNDHAAGSAGTGGPGAGGNTGVAGTGSGVGGQGGGATLCDGGAVFVCVDATKVCRPADCPGGQGGVGGPGNTAGTAGAAGNGGSSGFAGAGTAGTGQVGIGTLIACPATPPTGACSVEFMNCTYPDSNSNCRCTSGSWSCSGCASTPQATTGGAVCRTGNVTCSQFGCGVCPDAHPTAGGACGNTTFKCAYGNDVCLCGGNDGWKCTTLSCPPNPNSDHRPGCSSFSLSDGSNISFNYACLYPAEQQSCACNDTTGFGTFYCGCPAALPAEGSACIGPSPCSYGGVTCDCSAGHWQCGGGACPTTKPAAGAACATQVSCSYNNSDGGTDFCACNGSAWSCS
jgi:hypothetical protein